MTGRRRGQRPQRYCLRGHFRSRATVDASGTCMTCSNQRARERYHADPAVRQRTAARGKSSYLRHRTALLQAAKAARRKAAA